MKALGVLMKPFAHVRFRIQVQLVELLQQKQALSLNELCHVQGGFMVSGHRDAPE